MYYTQSIHAAAFLLSRGAKYLTATNAFVGGPAFFFDGHKTSEKLEAEFNFGVGDFDPQKSLQALKFLSTEVKKQKGAKLSHNSLWNPHARSPP